MTANYFLIAFLIGCISSVRSVANIDQECIKVASDSSGNHLESIKKDFQVNTTRSSKSLSSPLSIEHLKNDIGSSFVHNSLPLPTEVLDDLFGRRLFNTTMNYIVPLFEVMLPLHTDSGSTVHLAMQAFLGIFSAIAWISTVAIPVILTELVPFGVRKKSTVESDLSSFAEYSLPSSDKFKPFFSKEISKKIGLDWETCLCKTICQAQRSPKKYGMFAIPVLILFPPSSLSSMKNGDQFSIHQKAALDGLIHDVDCETIYKCFFDVLDLSQYLFNLYFRSNQKNKKLK